MEIFHIMAASISTVHKHIPVGCHYTHKHIPASHNDFEFVVFEPMITKVQSVDCLCIVLLKEKRNLYITHLELKKHVYVNTYNYTYCMYVFNCMFIIISCIFKKI